MTASDLYRLRRNAQDAETLYKARRGQSGAARSIEAARRAWIVTKAAYAAGAAKFYRQGDG